MIPRVFHFIWLTNNSISETSQRNLRLWKELHPDWQIQLWTKEMIYHITKQVNQLKSQKKTGIKNRFQTFAPHIFFPYAWFEKNPGPPYDEHSYTAHHFRPFKEIEQNGRDRS